MDTADADRLTLLDRLADRVPELDLDQHEIEWTEMPHGAAGLLIDGGGVDGGNGYTWANCREDLHAYGPTAPLFPGRFGVVAIDPDGNRRLIRLVAGPARVVGGRDPRLAARRGGSREPPLDAAVLDL